MSLTKEATILDRLLNPVSDCLTPEVADRLIKLRADPVAQARIDELARKSNAGLLSAQERSEYQTYISAGTFIAILQSKARMFLAAERSR